MNFIEFQRLFSEYPVVSVREIQKVEPMFNLRNLGNWQKKGYLTKVRNGWYVLTGQAIGEPLLFAIANQIYVPSYVSLESALSWHGLIPEGVFQVTSVSSRKTQIFDSPMGRFAYHSLSPALLAGYRMLESGGWRFKMAEPEKALLDFLHLRPEYDTLPAIESLRLNSLIIQGLNREKIMRYAALYSNKSLLKRLKHLDHAFAG